MTSLHIDTLLVYIHYAYNMVVLFGNLFETEVDMSIKKRLTRLWTLLTTEEVFDEHGSLGRRTVVRRAPRA